MNRYSAELSDLLNKMNELHQKIANTAQPYFIDLHLLCDYTRKYYDLLIATNAIAGAAPVTNISTFEIKQVVKEQPAISNVVNEQQPVMATPLEEKVEAEIPVEESKPANVIQPTAPVSVTSEKFKEYTSIGDKFAEQQTVGHKFSGTSTDAVTTNIKAMPLADLNEAIGINERFAFANVFMNGDINSFYSALAKINSKANFEEAFIHFKTEVVEKFNVDKNNKLYREFIELLQRRFMK